MSKQTDDATAMRPYKIDDAIANALRPYQNHITALQEELQNSRECTFFLRSKLDDALRAEENAQGKICQLEDQINAYEKFNMNRIVDESRQ